MCPGRTESCVWPQMPVMMRLLESWGSETAMSQVEVPMTLTSVPRADAGPDGSDVAIYSTNSDGYGVIYAKTF